MKKRPAQTPSNSSGMEAKPNNIKFLTKIARIESEIKNAEKAIRLNNEILNSEQRARFLRDEIESLEKSMAEKTKKRKALILEIDKAYNVEIKKTELVAECLFPSFEYVTQTICPKIKNCAGVIMITLREGFFIFGDGAYFRHAPFKAPDGVYYMFLTPWDCVVEDIYRFRGDVRSLYSDVISNCKEIFPTICNLCHKHKRDCRTIAFNVPGIEEFLVGESTSVPVTACLDCFMTDSFIAKLVAYTQMVYNAHIRIQDSFKLLLCAHGCEETNVFYKYNLPPDLFKVIMREAFPAYFGVFGANK